jgi:murein DD-endopeptidase MepM/ murein hydrolase activator NlpD
MHKLHTTLRPRWQPLAVIAAAVLALPASAAAQGPMFAFAAPEPIEAPSREPGGELRARHLLIPVEGITAAQLRDTYSAARSGGRVHDAIDIHAPRGTPVLAVADGIIRKLHSGSRGGHSIYQIDDDGRTRYYYAHLDHYADGIAEGRPVRRGEVIGYVGDSGNAQPGDYHLHFSIAILDNPSRWWEGLNVNPYAVLTPGSTRLAGNR